jgi:hypothetical protein
VAVVGGTAPPNLAPVAAWAVPVAVVAVVRSWPVALPMLNDPDRGEREGRTSPIVLPVAPWAVPVVPAVPASRRPPLRLDSVRPGIWY